MLASILDLPTELIVEIIHSDNSTDATTLACLGMTCRRLHDICQVFVLERRLPLLRALAGTGCLRIYKDSGSVAMKREELDDVKEIFQASFHKIEYAPVTKLASEEIASIHGLIFHANAVGHIALHFDFLPIIQSSHWHLKDWYKPLASLVGTSSEKMALASLTITGSPQPPPQPPFKPFTPIPETQKSEISIFGRLKNHFFGGTGIQPNRQTGAPEMENPNTGIYFGALRELKSFEIDSPLPFHDTCFPHTLRVLNGGYLTKLSLGHSSLRISDWSNILPLLSMSLLSEFKLRNSKIDFRDLSAFLLRHSSIIHLDLSDNIPTSEPIMPPKGFLPRLEVISGDPDYLSGFLSRQGDLFPHLRSVALMPYLGLRTIQYGALKNIFRNLADRKRGTIHLSIEFSAQIGLTQWFYMARSKPCSLDCVKTLEIIRFGIPISSEVCDSFFYWVSDMFPCVQKLDLRRIVLPDPNIWTWRVDALWDSCPELQSIIVGVETYQRPVK
ncbi:uncharacterized protein LACBIDRAFT_295094 [Laccaria bicolor S238N-H82]|uniref:Predicted protein n=1 Tax=Laccaria bicolor (strain S238N-H82 / ATCC MYA-4686) TaxID=486041 RepID=B0DMN4_LACBS|nr:uncharacterized protein LACBIDRAFT_295094 [Laccaria bicolor S238N-H82]EDR04219.1 predicted protein [Laccaria bicolor S238N-H82]|eukprot:XP_001885110.1 predicted protein [Laccaria bicolor S238N-H82]